MAEDWKNTDNAVQQILVELKKYMQLQSDYLQVTMVEKLTKLMSKLIIAIVALMLVVLILFYLLFALAHALAPVLGFVASFSIVAAIFLVMLVILIVFKKQLIVNPILKLLVDVFYDMRNEGKKSDEDNATTL